MVDLGEHRKGYNRQSSVAWWKTFILLYCMDAIFARVDGSRWVELESDRVNVPLDSVRQTVVRIIESEYIVNVELSKFI